MNVRTSTDTITRPDRIDTMKARGLELIAEQTAMADLLATENRAARTEAEEARHAAILAELDQLEAAVVEHRKAEARRTLFGEATPRGGAVVKREARTYRPGREARGGENIPSFFQDAYARANGDEGAAARMARHLQEARVEGEGVEHRATTTTSFAGLVVPQYLVDEAALLLRNGRPIANAVRRLPLPDQGTSFIVPRGTTGASSAVQATENSNVSSTDEVWANVTVPVVTIAGQQDVSRQALERGTPGLDSLVWIDLCNAYFAAQGAQIINGTGAGGQMLGILNTAGINTATAFGAAPTGATFTSKVAGGVQAISGAGTYLQPRLIVMHPRRWGWLQSLVDTTGRPLGLANAVANFNALAVVTQPGAYSGDTSAVTTGAQGSAFQIVGVMPNGLPVITDANIPTNLGTPAEDVVLVLDTMQHLLWEDGDGMPKMLRFEQTLGNQLTVKMVAYGYSAFTAGRYPNATSRVGGADTVAAQGLVAPTF